MKIFAERRSSLLRKSEVNPKSYFFFRRAIKDAAFSKFIATSLWIQLVWLENGKICNLDLILYDFTAASQISKT